MRFANNEKGSTMIETILYISVLGTLGVILASYVGAVLTRYKTGRIAQQILDLKKAIVNFTAADDSYVNLDEELMQAKKAIPLDMRNLHHALSGKITFGPVGDGTIDSNDKYLFYITFEDIYQKGCIELLLQGQFYNNGSDLDALIVNNNTAWYYEYSFYDTTQIHTRYKINSLLSSTGSSRPTLEQISKACNRKNDNDITWIFS